MWDEHWRFHHFCLQANKQGVEFRLMIMEQIPSSVLRFRLALDLALGGEHRLSGYGIGGRCV